jgi:hypothetical protein
LEQKPSLRKEIVYSGPTSGITKKSESGNKTVLNLASESDRCLNSNQTDNIFNPPKRLNEAKMNLGFSCTVSALLRLFAFVSQKFPCALNDLLKLLRFTISDSRLSGVIVIRSFSSMLQPKFILASLVVVLKT